jgi:thymidylate kinase
MHGILIALEGVNGCGKSSIINQIVNYYTNIGQIIKVYKFPDRTGKYGAAIDDHLHKKNVFEYKYDLLDAFAANRLSVKDNIYNDILSGYIVICDRYFFSGIAYHIPLGSSKKKINLYNNIIGYFDKSMPIPDMTYLIDGDYLKYRKENPQRYHYDSANAYKLFNIFREVINMNTTNYSILKNEYGKSDKIATYIINDINYGTSINSRH